MQGMVNRCLKEAHLHHSEADCDSAVDLTRSASTSLTRRSRRIAADAAASAAAAVAADAGNGVEINDNAAFTVADNLGRRIALHLSPCQAPQNADDTNLAPQLQRISS